MATFTPEDDIEISMIIAPECALKRMHESPYVMEMVLKMKAWIGEFGEPDVFTALAVASAISLSNRKKAAARSTADGGQLATD